MIHIIFLIFSMTLGFYAGIWLFTLLGMSWVPFGGMVGSFVGYVIYYNILDRNSFSSRFNRSRTRGRRPRKNPWRRMSGIGGNDPFAQSGLPGTIVATIVLAAKMAKADGHVSAAEIRAFRRVVDITQDQEADVARIWREAKRTASGYEPYARHLKNAVGNPELLEQILDCLVAVAHADRNFSAPERRFLEGVAAIFGLQAHQRDPGPSREERARQKKQPNFTAPPPQSPYRVLDLPQNASVRQIKKAYRDLARKHHPDYLYSQGLSEAMVARAHDQMVKINAAYEQIRKERGFR